MSATADDTSVGAAVVTGNIVDPFYAEYKDAGFRWALFFPPLFYALLAMVGLPLNFSVCWVTYKYRHANRSLASNTATLIALQCFFELFHQLFSHFFYLAATVFGVNFIRYRTALAIHAIAVFGGMSSLALLPLLAVDRLLTIVVPVFYYNLRQRVYISAHLLALFAYNVYLCWAFAQAGWNSSKDLYVGCFVGAIFQAPEVRGLIDLNFALICATIPLYLLVIVLVKIKKGSTSPNMQKLYRSVLLIVAIHVGGFFLDNAILVLLPHLQNNISPIQMWFVIMYAGLLFDASTAVYGPILYFNSSEHKNAYKKEFLRIFTKPTEQSSVIHIIR